MLGLTTAFMYMLALFGHRSSEGEERQSVRPNNSSEGGKVSVEVYYEVLCPDSRHFLLKQLQPTWNKIGPIMDVHLKPYGKASHKKGPREWEFSCQHGPTECQGNIIHACASKKITDSDKLMEYVTCMIADNYSPMDIAQKCAEQVSGVDWNAISRCSVDREGQDLLAELGDDTKSLRPKVSFIPTVVLNGKQDDQRAILKNLLAEVCKKYEGQHPSACIEVL